MRSRDLEDLTLLLVRDADEPEMWLDRWLLSYPVVHMVKVSRHQCIIDWQSILQAAFAAVHSKNIMVVAHGAGVSGFLAWLYQTGVNVRQKIRNIILVSPLQDAFPDDKEHSLQRVRCDCPAALVIGRMDSACPRDWAEQQARLWNMRLLVAPYEGRLNGSLQGWQWGMKLMQEMLHSE